MKQNLAALALLLCGVALFQSKMPAPDPSGKMVIEMAKTHGKTLTKTGLVADPSGTAVFQTATQNP
jgi:hypothetical protein